MLTVAQLIKNSISYIKLMFNMFIQPMAAPFPELNRLAHKHISH